MRALLVEAKQHGSICIQDLTKVVMFRRRCGPTGRRREPTLIGPQQWTTQGPLGRSGLLQLNGDRRAAVDTHPSDTPLA